MLTLPNEGMVPEKAVAAVPADTVEDNNFRITVDLQRVDEDGKDIEGSKSENMVIDLSDAKVNSPKVIKNRNFHLRERSKFFTQLRRDLVKTDHLSIKSANKIIQKIKTGEIDSGRKLRQARNDFLYSEKMNNISKRNVKYTPKK